MLALSSLAMKSTKETFVDGWLRTGDEVIVREDLEVFIVDRLKVHHDSYRINFECLTFSTGNHEG
jgi:acyl-CoA synthetase (AMP-forming)/AMP-acid ligase II